ncbi:hypothetical protein C4F51_05325 [Cellvibrio sp. KB43]|uniref:Uncharacterized protein n=1 Tax=Cellvibrio polysaccharolyticus TaxID=2082724 RepID=A0A928YT86_9GAMM|nr:hypothetical protein [Cellvibrio polysaccharolyticus]
MSLALGGVFQNRRVIRHLPVAYPAGSFAVQMGNPANLSCVFETHRLMANGQRDTWSHLDI